MTKIDAVAGSVADNRDVRPRHWESASEAAGNGAISPARLKDDSRVSSASSQTDRPSIGMQFESMFLRQAFEDMLPKDSDLIYGGGTAGGFWRSMLAENLANALADRNILGLAATVEPTLKSNSKDDAE